MLYIYDVKLPELYLNQYLYTFADYEDKTLLAILYAVQYGYNLNDLTKGYKINSSNVSFINKLKFNNKVKNITSNMSEILYEDRPYEICFYAILIKE